LQQEVSRRANLPFIQINYTIMLYNGNMQPLVELVYPVHNSNLNIDDREGQTTLTANVNTTHYPISLRYLQSIAKPIDHQTKWIQQSTTTFLAVSLPQRFPRNGTTIAL
jgi:hypothetical protein